MRSMKSDALDRVIFFGEDSVRRATSSFLDQYHRKREKGGQVIYHDPYVPRIIHDSWELDSAPDVMDAVRAADCVVIITNHSAYDYPAILDAARLIVDSRNAMKLTGTEHPKVVKL